MLTSHRQIDHLIEVIIVNFFGKALGFSSEN